MADYNIDVNVRANLGAFDSTFDKAAARVRRFGSDAVEAGQRVHTGTITMSRSAVAMARETYGAIDKNRAAAEQTGKSLLGFGAAVAFGLGAATKAAIDWESAWAGVVKTTEDGANLEELEAGIRGLTAVLPASHQEIAAVAEAAGQLGVKSKDVVGFTKVMIDLGEATDLTSDEAATSLAQISNIMGTMAREGVEGVSRLGATLVHLGNNGASTESQIVRMALRIAGAGKTVGLVESEVLALASGMASLGIRSEVGGSVISRVMTTIAGAVADGGAEVANFARVAGMSSDDFVRAWEEKPAEALNAVISGLGGMQEAGGNVFATLKELGFETVEMRDVLLRMASAGDLQTQAFLDANEAWSSNTALVEEAEKRYETTASKIGMARNQLTEMGIEIGGVVLPAVADLADGASDLFRWFSDLPPVIQDATVLLGGMAGGTALVAGGLLVMLPRILETREAVRALAGDAPRTARALQGLGRAAGVAGAALAIGYLVAGLTDLVSTNDPVALSVADTTKAILDLDGAADATTLIGYTRAVNDLGKETTALVPGATRGAESIYDVNDAIRDLTSDDIVSKANRFGQALDRMTGLNIMSNQNAAAEQFKATDTALRDLVASGNVDLAEESFRRLYAGVDQTTTSFDDYLALHPEYAASLTTLETNATGAAGASAELAASTDLAAASAGMSSEAWEEAAEAIREQRDAWDEAARSFVDVNGTYVSMLAEQRAAQEETARDTAEKKGLEGDAWEQFVGDVAISMDAYLEELRRQEEAQANWQRNITALVGKVSDDTLNYLAQLGPEAAPLVQALVDGTDAQLQEFDRLTNATMAGATAGWVMETEQAGPLLQAVTARLGTNAANTLAERIRSGQVTVAEAAAELGATIKENVPGQWTVEFRTSGIDAAIANIGRLRAAGESLPASITVRTPTGPQVMRVPQAVGHVVMPMAHGGTLTPMEPIAQMVPPNTWRVVGDRLDVPESYIPHDGSLRSRALLEQTAAMMGMYVLPRGGSVRHLADGAVLGVSQVVAAGAAGIDPGTLAAAFQGLGLTLMIEGRPISAIVESHMSRQARAIASGRQD